MRVFVRGAAAALACFAATFVAAQAPPVFRAGVEAVHVDVFVSQGGRPVPALRASDFDLRDDGVPQSVELVSADAWPVQAVLAFDTSSSMAGEKLAALRGAGGAFLEGLGPRDSAALLTFSDEIAVRSEPTLDKVAVRAALGRLGASGPTTVYDALFAALVLPESRTPALVVLFTDGDDNVSVLGQAHLRRAAERANAILHVVGLRPMPRSAETSETVRVLTDIADRSGGRFWTAESPDRLRAAFAAIASSMSERYILRYEPQGARREGWHRLSVHLRSAKGTVRSRRGYWLAARTE